MQGALMGGESTAKGTAATRVVSRGQCLGLGLACYNTHKGTGMQWHSARDFGVDRGFTRLDSRGMELLSTDRVGNRDGRPRFG